MNDILARLAFQFSGLWTPLLYLALLLAAVLVVQRFSARRASRRRRQPERRRSLGARRRAQAESTLDAAEFEAAVGVSPSAYRLRTLVMTGVVVALTAFATGSWALMLLGGCALPYWRRGRARSKVQRARDSSLLNELLPAAEQIAYALGNQMQLGEAIRTVSDSSQPTPLQRSLRRALIATDLETGLREEMDTTNEEILREFFEILADGASMLQTTIVTRKTLDKFVEVNEHRLDAWQRARAKTARARFTRNSMLVLVPLAVGLTASTVGPATMFGSFGGNAVIMLAGLFIALALAVSNRMLNGVMRGF
jgi:hypothetical protein